MSLKKTDKIIAVVGVVIIIVAIAGILFYFETEDDVDDGEPKDEMNEFMVEWQEYSAEMPCIKESAKTKYNDSINIMVAEGCVIKDVVVEISWSDDHVVNFALPNRKGQDTLKAMFRVIGSGDEFPHTSTGSGSENHTFLLYASMPQDEIIEDAEDIYDAEEMVKEQYSGKNSVDIDVEVKVNIGEKFALRPMKLLNKLLDKGDDFEIMVKYNYYKPYISEMESDNDDGEENNDTSLITSGIKTGAYTCTNYGLTKI